MFATRIPAMPVIGRADPGPAEVELGVGERGAGRGDPRLLCLHVGVRLLEGRARLRDVRLRVQHCGARGRHRRQVGEVALDRVVELLLTDRPPLGQRRVAGDVELRLLCVASARLTSASS